MDAIFALPCLSLFLVPVLSSYTTTLNLLFFYMTWTTLVLSHPPLRVELFATATIRLIFYLFPSLLFFFFDILTPSAAVVIKAQGEAGLPGGSSRRARIRWREIKVALWGVGNVVLGIVVQGFLEVLRTRGLGVKSAVRVGLKLPMPWEMVRDLVRGFLGREILSYTIHRYVLHNNNNNNQSSILQTYHSTWYHTQIRTPHPLTAHYDHPLVYLLSNFTPTYIPAMFFRFHLLTYLFYLSLVSIEETFAYSGYTIMPTSFFLGGIARRVELHVLSGGEGNFGPWGVLDWVFGTAVGGEDGDEDDEEGDGEEEQRAYQREIDEQVRKAIEVSRRRVQREERRRGSSRGRGRGRGRGIRTLEDI